MGIFNNIFTFFKREIKLNKEYYEELSREKKPLQKINAMPPKIEEHPNINYTVYCYGHLVRLFPIPSWPYSNHIDLICAANIIISEDVRYDLTRKESILSMAIPRYNIHGKTRIDKDLGIASSLEFALRMKGEEYWKEQQYELAIACYGKATQLMAVSDEYWDKDDFFLIVNRLNEIGREEHANRWIDWLNRNIYANDFLEKIEKEIRQEEMEKAFKKSFSVPSIKNEKEVKISAVEKEKIMVNRITTEDMLQFTAMPYQLNCPVFKINKDGGHPFAYMDLNQHNQTVAKNDLKQLDDLIRQARNYIPLLAKEYHIDIQKIVFCEYSPHYGYTRLICTPYTFKGNVSKFPLSLSFMTRGDVKTYSANGEIFYNKDGTLGKATVNIWRSTHGYSQPGTGWNFTFKVAGGIFTITEAKSTLHLDKYGRPTTVYKLEQKK